MRGMLARGCTEDAEHREVTRGMMADSKPADAKSERAVAIAPGVEPTSDLVQQLAASAVASEADSDAIENAHSANNASTSAAQGSRKRVFTFQKRWLHTLPIMEKVLTDSALDTASLAALKAANLLGEDGKPIDDAAARDVVVCMLCDDPSSSRETLKMWSRVNCRRGRIENHLMSKHPEFMLLLKQKREAEGDLTVQIFLQHMREGRCNVRSEISAGLYSHLQIPTVAPGVSSIDLHGNGQKRQFEHGEVPGQKIPGGGVGNSSSDAAESKRKRAKTEGVEGEVDSLLRMRELVHSSLLSYVGPSAFAQWRAVLAGKMIVVTGGENPCIARIASNLWLLGANILVTFSDLSTTETFSANYLAQFQATESGEPPRGAMLPIFCTLQTRVQIQEWTQSISGKFDHVDFMINFVGEEDLKERERPEPANRGLGDQDDARIDDEPVMATTTRLADLCQIFTSTCMQQSHPGSVVNIATPAIDSSSQSAYNTATDSLARELSSSNVRLNSIAMHGGGSDVNEVASAHRELELLHSLLFLLSPASSSISGTVINIQRSHQNDEAIGIQEESNLATESTAAIAALDV